MRYLLFSLLLALPMLVPQVFNDPDSDHSPSLQGQIKKFQLNGFAQGTTWTVTYYSTDRVVGHVQIDSILNEIDSSLSIYKPYSRINAFNQSEKGIEVDKHFLKVVRKSLRTFKETRGLFDITVQPLVRAWGFGNTRITHLPDSQRINALLKCVGSKNIAIKGNRVVKKKPCITIDVDGIAQGYSVDVLADFL